MTADRKRSHPAFGRAAATAAFKFQLATGVTAGVQTGLVRFKLGDESFALTANQTTALTGLIVDLVAKATTREGGDAA